MAATLDLQRNLKKFQRKANSLLTDLERDYLHDILRQYHTYKDVEKLMICLQSALDTPRKKDLLKEIRSLIPSSHVQQFDELAPYSEMAHPYSPTTRRKREQNTDGSVHVGQHSPSSLCHITIQKVCGSLGFSIRGGSEHGLGIFVSSVDARSPAEENGLELGDQLIEVNNVNFENIATSSAVMVLQGSNRLRMKVKRTGKVPGFKFAREKTSWYDTVERTITDNDEQCESTPPRFNMSGTRMLQDAGERRVIIKLYPGQCIGFNLRGGSEYSLGIYVSKLDKGGQAFRSGIQVGDQIVNVNGESFLNISHARAIDFLRHQRHLIMTIKTVNRYPAYKEMVAEYSWVNEQPVKNHKRPQSRNSSKVPPLIPPYANGSNHLIPMDHIERFTQTPLLEEGGVQQKIPLHENGMNRLSMPSNHTGIKPHKQYKRVASTGDINHLEGRAEGVNPVFDNAVLSRRQSQPPPYSAVPQDNHPPSKMLQATATMQNHSKPPPVTTHQDLAATDDVDSVSAKSVQTAKSQPVMGTSALKSDHRNLGRSHSMKHPGEVQMFHREKDLPPMQENRPGSQKVKRNRTFREILFGMKMKRKEKDKQSSGSMSAKIKRRNPLGSFRKPKTSTSLDGLDKVSGEDSDPMWANKAWAVRRSSMGDLRSVEAGSSHGSDGKQSIASVQATSSSNSPEPEIDFGPAMSCMMELAQRLLKHDECTAIVRHIKRYHEDRDIEHLVHPLLAILDKPEKVILLREIRSTLYQTDIGRFESMVSRREADAFEELQSGTSNYIRRSPMLRRANKTSAPKKTILETKPNSVGGFHLQTTQNMNREKRRKEELDRLKRERQEEIQKKMKEQKEADEYTERTIAYGHVNNKQIRGRTSDFKLMVPDDDIYDLNMNNRNSSSKPKMMILDHNHNKHKQEFNDHLQMSDDDTSDISSVPEKRPVKNGRTSEKRSKNKQERFVSDYLRRDYDSNDDDQRDDDSEISTVSSRKSVTNGHRDRSSGGHYKSSPPESSLKQENPKKEARPSSGLSNNFEDLDSSLGSGKFTANPIFGMDNLPKQTAEEPEENAKPRHAVRPTETTVEPEENTRPRSAVRFELFDDFISSVESSPRDSEPSPRLQPTPDIVVNDELDFVIEDNESVESDGSLDHVPTKIDDDVELELQFSDESDMASPPVLVGSRKGKYKFTMDDSDASSTSTIKERTKKKSNIRRKTPSPVNVRSSSKDRKQKNNDFSEKQHLSVDGMEDYFAGRDSSLSFDESPTFPKKGILKNKAEKPVLSNGYHSEEEPFPLKEILQSARMEYNIEDGPIERVIKKTQTSLGISISGGSDSRQQPQVLIDKVFPGGAAHDDGFIQPGFQLIKVNGRSLHSLTHNQVVEVIRKAYNDANRDRLSITVLIK
ncbi:uncharacterized protein [Antedon mediterranea]|uniref:uncharacterized protein n=1 Tax=Antedon mediterranea TaxID=105859 RepID=UPI003AF8FCA9